MERVAEMVYKDGRIKVKLCYESEYCEVLEYEALERRVFETGLANLIGEMNDGQVISCVSEACREFWELWSKS
ncbi:MAG: hypothetical protein DRO12_01510 [Thermoprotei archaeon]|nr:MAG: hypothetical protein DRO12_01510 [Thermoprotei archaeon]